MKDQRIGEIIGEYRLIRRIGRGHFANVYLGQHIYLQTFVAIKILHSSLGESALDSFMHEAETIASLEHPHIVRVQEFGVEESSDTPFLVMDYAPLGSLRERHPEGEKLPLPVIINYVKQLADALAYAHNARLIHRDVKPENILLGSTQELLLSDFSLVTVAHSSASLKTIDNSGTVHYMAPEQIQGRPRTASDQYSLGIMVYEWLCGERPFEGSTSIEIAFKHLNSSLPPLHEKVPSIDPYIENVIEQALAKDPKQRFSDIASFATTLEQAAQPFITTKSTASRTTEENMIRERQEIAIGINTQKSQKAATGIPDYIGIKPQQSQVSTYLTLLEIGSSTVKAAIVKVDRDQQREILGLGKQGQKEGALAAGIIMDKRKVKLACWEALKKAQQMAGGLATTNTYVGISNELIRGSSLTVHKERQQPARKITLEEWEQLEEQAFLRLKQRQEQQGSEGSEYQGMQMTLIDKRIAAIRIDGQGQNDPIGQSGQHLFFDIFATFLPAQVYEDVQAVTAEMTQDQAQMITVPYALAAEIANIDPDRSDTIVIDIGSEKTAITILRNKEICQTQAFAFGGEAFTYHLATRFGLEQEVAEILKLKYSRGQLPMERQKYIQSLLAVQYKEWFDTVVEYLEVMARGKTLPGSIYVVGGGLAFPDATIRLKGFPWSKYLSFEQNPILIGLEQQDLTTLSDPKHLLREKSDIVLISLAAGAIKHQKQTQQWEQRKIEAQIQPWEAAISQAMS